MSRPDVRPFTVVPLQSLRPPPSRKTRCDPVADLSDTAPSESLRKPPGPRAIKSAQTSVPGLQCQRLPPKLRRQDREILLPAAALWWTSDRSKIYHFGLNAAFDSGARVFWTKSWLVGRLRPNRKVQVFPIVNATTPGRGVQMRWPEDLGKR